MDQSIARFVLIPFVLIGLACKGSPARLVTGPGDTVVVNNVRSVKLATRVRDERGHALDSSGVRYQWLSGEPIALSPSGVVKCTDSGDAIVQASLGSLVRRFYLLCRPVRTVRGSWMLELVLGDPPQQLPFDAIGPDSQPVTLLRGNITIADSNVATVEGGAIRARAPGNTMITMRLGDREASTGVLVFERRATPEGIRPGEHVAVPVRLARGELRQWRISPGEYFVAMLPDSTAHSIPGLAIVGANCSPAGNINRYFCLAQRDASLSVYHSDKIDHARDVSGVLAMWRQDNR